MRVKKYWYMSVPEVDQPTITTFSTDNPTVSSVVDSFKAISKAGDPLALSDGELIPKGRYTENIILEDRRLTHFQGMQRLRKGQYMVISGGDKVEQKSHLFIVKMGSRKATGGWRSNTLASTIFPANDRMLGIVEMDDEQWHAGGISVLGDILAVPIYSTEDPVVSTIAFYNVQTPERPERLKIDIKRPGVRAGAVGLFKDPESKHFIAAVWSDADPDIEPRLDFYVSKTTDLMGGFGDAFETQWFKSEVMTGEGQDANFSNFQTVNFVSQTDDEPGCAYLIGLHNDRPFRLGEDFADLFKIENLRVSIDEEPPTLSHPTITKIENKKFENPQHQFHMAAAAGVYLDKGIDSKGSMRVYSTYYWRYGSRLNFAEFRPEGDSHLEKVEKAGDSWVDLYEDDNFGGRRVSVRDITMGQIDDFKQLLVKGGDFAVCVSSAKYQIPVGLAYRLYDRSGCKGQYIDLQGTGKAEEIKNFKTIRFGAKVSSSHPKLKNQQSVSFGDRVLSARSVGKTKPNA